MNPQSQSTTRKKTPRDATAFEREQLRFLLSGEDVAGTLVSVNPSLAWLPVFRQMKLVEHDHDFVRWIEGNFADLDAVRDVVDNIDWFGPDTAALLEFRLNTRASTLSPLLMECWRLVIRHMKTAKRGLGSEWFDIAPQVRRGDHSTALLERIAQALRPQLKVGKLISFDDSADARPERPRDVMKIDYEISDDVTAEEVLEAWPKEASAETDRHLLSQLTAALTAAVADATDVGVECNRGFSASDLDVPSVAEHPQNQYRSGFYALVRVIAEVWLRLAQKAPPLAIEFVQNWSTSNFRLVRRLALFACAEPVVPADMAADILVSLPAGDLFLTNSSVETYRLISKRWNEFAAEKQQSILRRLREGPPRDWFREQSEVDQHVDRSRFDILGAMNRDGLAIGQDAESLLSDIRSRWPKWELRPPEQNGFHIWHESGPRVITGDAGKLEHVPDDELVTVAREIAAKADFLDGDAWQALCLSKPDRALHGLDAAAGAGDWPVEFWQQLLWARKEYVEPHTERRIAELLKDWPVEQFATIARAASSWLDEHTNTLDERLLWALWDRIADATLIEGEDDRDE